MKHRRLLALASALALAAGPAAADCSAVFKTGTKFHIVEKQVGGSRPITITVGKNEKGYVRLDVTIDQSKEKFSMPGHVDGDAAMFAGAQRPVVWTCSCKDNTATCADSGPDSTGTSDIKLVAGK
jgi:hypothetical protein